MKENKKRIIFWAIVMLIFLSLAIFGRNSFNNGYGTYGSIKKKLDPIALEFNTSDYIKKLTDIRADVKKNKLIVTYINTSGKKEKYVYEYINSNGIEYITNTDEYSSNIWSIIAVEMINAVYHNNGGNGSVFDLYEPSAFVDTTLSDGVQYNDITKVVSININTNVVKNIQGRVPSKRDHNYVKEENLTTLVTDLNGVGSFKYKNDDINLYVKSTTISYEIYIAVTEDNYDRAMLSVANVVKVLKPEVYNTMLVDDKIVISDTTTSYQSHSNVTFSEANIFEMNDSIFELVLYK